MPRSFRDDPRIDPRLTACLTDVVGPGLPDLPSRDALLGLVGGAERGPSQLPFLAGLTVEDYERAAPSDGVTASRHVVDTPGGPLHVLVVRPEGDGVVPAVLYLHGGGMMTLSCFDDNYQAWARLVAAAGAVVVLPDFRNSLRPSSSGTVAPYPAGLDDCVAAFRWLREAATGLQADPARLVVAGDSGGANLAVATALRLEAAGELDGVAGLYLLCPYLAGSWPSRPGSSALENAGLLLDVGSNYAALAYGIEAFRAGDPQAWPGFATERDVAGFPPVVVSVNECDPLRDDGVAFFRLLLRAGVPARCRQVMGTVHGTEVYVVPCPDVSRDAARDLVALAAGDPDVPRDR